MRSATTYAYFLDDDFNIIKERFDNEKGFPSQMQKMSAPIKVGWSENAKSNEVKNPSSLRQANHMPNPFIRKVRLTLMRTANGSSASITRGSLYSTMNKLNP